MRTRPSRIFLIVALAMSAACVRASSAPSAPVIALDGSPPGTNITISGLSPKDRKSLTKLQLTADEWSAVLRVTVRGPQAAASLPIAGRYVVDERLTFLPSFPLDPGREYDVSFDLSKLAREGVPRLESAHAVVSLPALDRTPSTVVAAIYPSADVIPANQLRAYVQFSGPMGQQGGLEHIVLLDNRGEEMVDAMLPLDTELWSGDRTRYTVLFDPGRVKRTILPNRSMGRPLRDGDTVTLVVKPDWLDAHGVPLKAEFRRTYRVGKADERPLDVARWRLDSPSAGTRDPLTVTFPEPLDHGLLQRALSVSRGGEDVPGELRVEPGETRWSFVPRASWQAGSYAVLVLPILEDLAGNRIGRAFEVLSVGDAVAPEDSRPVSLPFQVHMANR